MRRRDREARRQQAEARRGSRVLEQQSRENHERQLATALKRERRPQQLVEELTPTSALLRRVPAPVQVTPRLRRLLMAVATRAPRLLQPDYVRGLYYVSGLDWVSDLAEWKPQGKGRDTLYRHICSYLLSRYHMPAVLWGALLEPGGAAFAAVVGEVAGGGSLFRAVQRGRLPVPLPRQMCRDVLSATGTGFTEALRRAQVRAFGGDRRLQQAWMATDVGRLIHDAAGERFWESVLRWFCQHPMLDRRQVGPLLDYITFRRREDAGFSMKGRSPMAMLRAMDEWHGQLARERIINRVAFASSGIKPFEYTLRSGKGEPEVPWTVQEILTSRELAAEGRALGHCVYSYAWHIETDGRPSGRCGERVSGRSPSKSGITSGRSCRPAASSTGS